MLEALLSSGGSQYIPWSGPGPKTLIKGTRKRGYFGQLSGNEFFSRWLVAASVTEAVRPTYYAGDTTWFKFMYNDRVLFVCKSQIAGGISWQELYDSGVVFGQRGRGKITKPVNGPVDQLKTSIFIENVQGEKKRWPLKLQLLTGADDAFDATVSDKSGVNEWDELFREILSPNGKFDNVSYNDTIWSTSYYNLMQNIDAAEQYAAMRGAGGNPITSNNIQLGQSYTAAYRPVFELIHDGWVALDPINLNFDVQGTTLRPAEVTFSGPDDIAKDVVDVVITRSYLATPYLDISTPVPSFTATSLNVSRNNTFAVSTEYSPIGVTAVNIRTSLQMQPEVVISSPPVMVTVDSSGPLISDSIYLSNTDLAKSVGDVKVRAGALLPLAADVSKEGPRFFATSGTGRSGVIASSMEGLAKPIASVNLGRGAAIPASEFVVSKQYGYVTVDSPYSVSGYDVTFTPSKPKTLAEYFANEKLNGFTI